MTPQSMLYKRLEYHEHRTACDMHALCHRSNMQSVRKTCSSIPAMYAHTHASNSAAQHSTAGPCRANPILHDCEEIWLRAAQIAVEC